MFIYNVHINNRMQHKKAKKPMMGTKHGKGAQNLPHMKAKKPLASTETMSVDRRGGPEHVQGLNKAIEPTSKKNLYNSEKFSLGVEKAHVTTLNRSMTNKSAFDTLYEEVMDNPADLDTEHEDLDALDVDTDSPDEGMGGDEITITLSRELAQQLHDAIMGQLEGGMEDEMSDEELGAEDLGADMGDEEDDFGGEDDDTFPESVVVEPEPKPLGNKGDKLMSKGSMKAGGTVTGKSGGKAAATGAKITLQSEPKELKHTVNDGKGGKMKVSNLQPGKSLFD
jgi:hypothetical protein